MTDDGTPGVAEALDAALMETHHLANLSGLDEAKRARRRLVEAQSADSVARTRDRLEQATEYLELARLERRDTAASFVQAREMVAYAQAGLRRERPVPLEGSPLELVRTPPEPEERRSLQELREDAAVASFDQLRYDVRLAETFRELRRQIAEGEVEHEPAAEAVHDVEDALAEASLEMDIERSIQRPDEDSSFQFVEDADLASDGGTDRPDVGGDRTGTPAGERSEASGGDEAEGPSGDHSVDPDGDAPDR